LIPISELKNLWVGYRKNLPILEEINMQIGKGEICALLGPNGSGKTTLVRTWVGLLSKIQGEILSIPDLSFSLVPQAKNMNFAFPMTVKDTLLLPKKAERFFSKADFTDADKQLVHSSGLDLILNKQLRECSGGQLQKVLIVRSLLSNAKLIFLDEPTDALDPGATDTMFEILESKRQEGVSFFIITHNVSTESIARFSRIFKVQKKRIVESC
jgi:ABC-type Mn2+/Zn2+ transport system ATPase subunit